MNLDTDEDRVPKYGRRRSSVKSESSSISSLSGDRRKSKLKMVPMTKQENKTEQLIIGDSDDETQS